ncbi:cell wall metabolism sensor histidine kinase WalK [Streptococcus pneumoniae]
MLDLLKQTIFTRDFIFILILLGFILVVTLLLLENRRDNIQLKQINQKVKDLIAGDYSKVLDMQGGSEITNITNNLNDLSEVIRLTQENLEQESKRLNSILFYMTDGVLATNRRGQIIMINDTAKKQLGLVKEDVLNRSILELLKIEENYELRDLITQSPELLLDSQDINGEYLNLRVRFALIRRESGFISGLVAVLHDTTEQEKEERERRLFVSNVSHELRTPLTSVKSYLEENYELRDLITQSPELLLDSQDINGEYLNLRVRFALIRRESGFISGLVAVLHDTTEQEKEERERRLFVSNVSHELRTPLTSVKSYLEALDEGALCETVAPDFIKVSLDETNRMMRMVTDLLHLSRIDNATSHLDVELINFTAFITFILNRFDKMKGQEKEKKYELVRDYPINSIWMEIDTDKMTQVVDNILNNAIKYSPDGGKITVRMKTTEDQMILSISDHGLGIPKQDLPRIFDRFYRVDRARSRAQGGTGLGLSIAKEIIKQHKGFIWAKSEYGKGSTFTIVLPYDKDAVKEEVWEDEVED